MNKEQLYKELNSCCDNGNTQGIVSTIKKYQSKNSEDEASRDLAEFILQKYTTYSADAMAGLMQIMIRDNPNLALLKFPENYFFKLAVLKGSVDLYQCFIEESIEPYLKDKDEDEIMDYYIELFGVASDLNDHFFPQYVPCVKGMDFNGVFGVSEKNSNVSLINTEDYLVLNDVVEKFNTILGRRDIVKDLEERM
jgi:hypothetical protein